VKGLSNTIALLSEHDDATQALILPLASRAFNARGPTPALGLLLASGRTGLLSVYQ